MAGLPGDWNDLRLPEGVRSVLDSVADRQLAEGSGPTVDVIVLKWPHEAAQTVRATIQDLVDRELVTVGSTSSGQETLHLTPLGLLASRHTGRVSEVAEAVLLFFKRRMADAS